MLTIIGSVLGFFTSALPRVFSFFEKKQDYAHEIEMVKLQQDGLEKAAKQQLDLAQVNADIREYEAGQKAQSTVTGTWTDSLTASVRPIITYAFFGLFAFVEIRTALIVSALDLSPLTKLGMIWSEETQALFAAIMSFWFGARGMDKAMARKRHA